MKTKQCLQCDTVFQKPRNESMRNWETRHKYCSRKCSDNSKKNKPLSELRKQQNREWSTGRKHTLESITKMSGANCHLWRGGKPKCIDCSKKVVNVYAQRCLTCSKKNMFGQNSANWQGGITPTNTKVRNSDEYKIWRKAVFERDNYTCQECKKRDVYFHADHIQSFANFPELRLKISNGRTLCVPCHYYATFKRNMDIGQLWGHLKSVAA